VKDEKLFGATKDFKRTDNNVGNGNHYNNNNKPSAVPNRRERDFNVASTRNDGTSAIPLRRSGSSGSNPGSRSTDGSRNNSSKRTFDKRRK
jgi:hypothetical protein